MEQIEQAIRERLERYRHLLVDFDDGMVREALLEQIEQLEHRLASDQEVRAPRRRVLHDFVRRTQRMQHRAPKVREVIPHDGR
jgi:hypothetical protein